MKKTLCILLALMLLVLTACETKSTVDTSSEAAGSSESVPPPPPPPSPWSELRVLSSELMTGSEYLSSPAFSGMSSLSSDGFEGTGSFYVTVGGTAVGEEEGMSFQGAITADADTTKTEYTMNTMGIDIPIILWGTGDESYTQFPTLYPDHVFRSSSVSGYVPSVGSDSALSLDGLTEKIASAFLEHASAETAMTVSEADGVKTFSLALSKVQAEALSDALDAILEESGLVAMLDGEGSLMGQLSTSGTPEEAPAVAMSLTVTTDGETYIRYLLEDLENGKATELTCEKQEGSVTYTLLCKNGEETEINLSLLLSAERLSVNGEMPSEDSAVKIQLDLIAESDTSVKIEGALTLTQEQGGFSMSIPLVIDGSCKAEGDTTSVDVRMTMETMGLSAEIAMGVSMHREELTLDFPYSPGDVIPFSEELLFKKIEDTYPELFEDTGRYFLSEDGSVEISLDSKSTGVLWVDGTYRRDGDQINITLLDDLRLEGTLTRGDGPNTYFWNSVPVEVMEMEDLLYLDCSYSDTWFWTAVLHDDGTCSVSSAFRLEEDSEILLFATDNELPLHKLEMLDEIRLRFCGVTLYDAAVVYFEEAVVYAADDTDLRLSISEYGEYRVTYTTSYQYDGETLTLKSFGKFSLINEGGEYFLSDTPCQMLTVNGKNILICQLNDQRLALIMNDDGTCNVMLQGYPEHGYESSNLIMTFRNKDEIAVKMYFNVKATNVTILGKVLELVSGDSSGM